jgi:beta-lactamase superfamily II metal-dependent hydrolase
VEKAGLKPGYGEILPVQEPKPGVEKFGGDSTDIELLNNEKFEEDTSEGNGSSIAFLAEFSGKRVLFSGDAHPAVVKGSLERLSQEKIKIDLLKLSHHGSAGNTGDKLIEKIACRNYLISTNSRKHPTLKTIAYLLKRGEAKPVLWFNYSSQNTKIWETKVMRGKYAYDTVYAELENLKIDILKL